MQQPKCSYYAGQVKKWFIGKEQDQGDVHGQQSEKLFEEMVRDLIGHDKIRWAQGIARATASEDILKGIDFRIRAIKRNLDRSTSEFSIPIQVKSSHAQADKFVAKNGTTVKVVVMSQNMDSFKLQRVLYSIFMKYKNS